ncbi:TetR/AcrR family transcriptional regulator [Alkalicaulis satelles]|uniref:TetR/AcrR family transcriptional regulator n=1 Tax=Alkalicaulis satelles TaxID=2609175 RepID=A0A5M6ZIU2_9PROT|nr:TetR/AcrR family transcriptional regulator [Alkalicaulis satelles]KAA5804736.1 TetR/AcrR family transcriptional regulator [Alkalicaulis satelles]
MTDQPATRPRTANVSADARGVTAPDGTAMARIERAALTLFARKGIDGVTTREIAALASVAEGSIYRHYPSKEALARALFEAIHSRLFALIEDALTGAGDDFETAVTRVVEVYCHAADADRVLFEYHITQMFRFAREDAAGRPDPTGLIARRIARAMAEGDCPRGDAELKTAAALGVVLQPAAHRMAGRLSIALSDHSQALALAALSALRAA